MLGFQTGCLGASKASPLPPQPPLPPSPPSPPPLPPRMSTPHEAASSLRRLSRDLDAADSQLQPGITHPAALQNTPCTSITPPPPVLQERPQSGRPLPPPPVRTLSAASLSAKAVRAPASDDDLYANHCVDRSSLRQHLSSNASSNVRSGTVVYAAAPKTAGPDYAVPAVEESEYAVVADLIGGCPGPAARLDRPPLTRSQSEPVAATPPVLYACVTHKRQSRDAASSSSSSSSTGTDGVSVPATKEELADETGESTAGAGSSVLLRLKGDSLRMRTRRKAASARAAGPDTDSKFGAGVDSLFPMQDPGMTSVYSYTFPALEPAASLVTSMCPADSEVFLH